EFYDSFEATIGLANDGDGMTDMEKLTTLKACLKQHRLKTYELIYRKNLGSGIIKEDPGEVYRQIKSKHLMFSETAEEKEIRVLEEGDALQKGKLSAFQWEVRWESHLADRDSVGLGLNAKEALIQYFRKIGPALSRDVRRDVFGQMGSESLAAKVCYEMRDKGTCSRGKDCKFSHDKAVVDEARRKWVKEKKQQERPSEEPVAKYEGGRKGGKGKGSGRKGADQGGSKGGQDDRESKACRFFNTAGGCSRGSKCPFSHASQKGSGGPPGKGNFGPHLQRVDGTGRGMECSNPFGCCSGNGRSQATEKVLATDPKAKGKKGKAGKQGKGKGNNNDLTSLDQLPQRWWTESPHCKGGYQYQTEVKVLDRYVGCLLDGCAGCNSITEEVVMGAIRAALQQGIGPDSERFPVAQLERWPQEEVVMGLANDAPIKLKGAVVMRVQMPDVNGQKVEEILVRAKVIGKGLSTWQGLILGGRALDAADEESDEVKMEGEVFVSEEDLVMEPMTGDWVRVTSQEGTSRRQVPEGTVILPFEGAKAEVVPGIWDPKQAEDQVYVAAQDTEIVISKGDPPCVAVRAGIEQEICPTCQVVEAAAWISGPECEACKEIMQANGKPQVVLLLAGLMAFLTAGVAAEGAEESPTDEYYHLLREEMEK
ncbi:Pro-Pol polyprotein, partial [Durusdinium trenchii]